MTNFARGALTLHALFILSDQDIHIKVVQGLERLAEVFRILRWEKSKVHGISPIQIQVLNFVASHEDALCNITHLAREFGVTKPTMSDAVRLLVEKSFLDRTKSSADSRSHFLSLTKKGQRTVEDVIHLSDPLARATQHLDSDSIESMYKSIVKIIASLNEAGIIGVQRTCMGCRFYQNTDEGHYCHFLEKPLLDRELRLDCPEYEDRRLDV